MNTMNTIRNVSINLEALMMDVYTLGRIFRFKNRDGGDSRLKIIYAGSSHIGRYLDFFRYLKKSDKSHESHNITIYEQSEALSKKYYRCVPSPHFKVKEYFQD